MQILVVGASVRAAAGSLIRAECRPVAADLFNDADLAAVAPCVRLDRDRYPGGIAKQVAHLAPLPWLYTGAIENHPDVVAAIARRSRLLGNGPEVLRAVRDPLRLAGAIRAAGLDAPAVAADPAGVPTDGSWLAKPRRSGGGEGIRPWLGVADEAAGPLVFQERVAGRSCSATFLAGPGGVEFVGATRQSHGRRGHPFAYRGSLGPWRFAPAVAATVEALGRVVGEAFGLVGLFGVDLIVAGDRAWPIEVNPRYTASVEILEQALRRPLLADHLRACGVEPPPAAPIPPTSPFVAREILYARNSCRFGGAAGPTVSTSLAPEVADIPPPGTEFATGEPILTVFGRGATPAGCRRDLARRVRRWEGRLRLAW